jgi:flagellar motor switch protein FliN/FliY
MAGPEDIPLPNLKGGGGSDIDLGFVDDGSRVPAAGGEASAGKVAQDLEHVFDVPVNVSAVLGRTRMEIGDLLRRAPGAVLELDRRVGEAIDIFVNDRLVARGEVVLVEDRLGVTMTEIIKADR